MNDYELRFDELITIGHSLPAYGRDFDGVEMTSAMEWATSSINLLEIVFGTESTITQRFSKAFENFGGWRNEVNGPLGILSAARTEYSRGYMKKLRREVSDELVIDLCIQAENLISEGYLQPAAVLAAAALEDCFRRKVEAAGLSPGDSITENLNALRGAGLLSGAAAKISSGFPKFRNAALHADWNKISEPEIMGITGFLKSYVIIP